MFQTKKSASTDLHLTVIASVTKLYQFCFRFTEFILSLVPESQYKVIFELHAGLTSTCKLTHCDIFIKKPLSHKKVLSFPINSVPDNV